MQQPHSFIKSNSTLSCKLNKCHLYGLKQAPRAWYEKLHQALIQFGFSSNKCDHSLMVYKHQDTTLYALVYVDGILLTSTPSKLIHSLITNLHDTFSLERLGSPRYFLDIEVHYLFNDSFLLIQTKYIIDLLSKVNMVDANRVSTTMLSKCKLSKHNMIL